VSARKLVILGAVGVAMLAIAGCGGIGKSQTHLRTAIDAKKPTLDDCYASALERDKEIAGSMTLWVHVAEKDGTVTQVEVANSTVTDAELTQCVETTLVGTQISPAPKANLKVEYQLELRPTSS
jgi:hypothetical protein